MKMPPGLATSSAQLLTIRGTRVLMQLAVMTVTARQFGPSAAGEFALALALTAPVFVILDLGLRTLYLSRTPRPAYRQLLSVRAVATACALAVCVGLGLLRPEMLLVVLVVALNKAAELFLELSIGPLQLLGRLTRATVVTLLASGTTVAVYLSTANAGFVPALAAAMFSGAALLSAGSLVLGGRAAAQVERGARHASDVRGLVRDGLALGLGNGIVSLATSVPQLILAATFSTVVSGRYAVMLYVVLAGEMVMNAVSQSVLPSVADRVTAEGPRGLRRWALRWTRIGTLLAVPAAVVAVATAAALLPRLLGEVYAMTMPEAAMLAGMLVLLPALFVGSVALQARNDYRTTALISVATLLVVTVSAFLLVPVFAATGALAASSGGTLTRIALAARRWARVPVAAAQGETSWSSP
jgi:O-antigen/teichoic acid export membrane protein